MRGVATALAILALASAPVVRAQVGGMLATDSQAGSGTRELENIEGPRTILKANAGTTFSDNIRRTDFDERDDVTASVGLVADSARKGKWIDYDLKSDVNYAAYLRHSYQSQPFGNLDGRVDFTLVPERLLWDFRETFTQAVIDPFGADTPGNRQNINYASTGPKLQFALGSLTRISLSGTYSEVRYSSPSGVVVSDDNNRYAAGVLLSHVLSGRSSVFLGVNEQHVSFLPSSLGENYTRQEGYGGYHLQTVRTSIDLSVGADRLTRRGAAFTGFLARVDLARRISPSSSISVRFARQVGDSADIFRSGFEQFSHSSIPLQYASNDPFRERFVGAQWSYQRGRTSLVASVSYTTDQYDLSRTLDHDVRAANVSLVRRISPTLEFSIGAAYARYLFNNMRLTNREVDLNAIMTWHLTRRLGLVFRYARTRYESTGSGSGFSENRIGVLASYAITGFN